MQSLGRAVCYDGHARNDVTAARFLKFCDNCAITLSLRPNQKVPLSSRRGDAELRRRTGIVDGFPEVIVEIATSPVAIQSIPVAGIVHRFRIANRSIVGVVVGCPCLTADREIGGSGSCSAVIIAVNMHAVVAHPIRSIRVGKSGARHCECDTRSDPPIVQLGSHSRFCTDVKWNRRHCPATAH